MCNYLTIVAGTDIIYLSKNTHDFILCVSLLKYGGDIMIMTYAQCLRIYGTDYKIKKEIAAGRLFQKEKGLYSDTQYCSDLEIISVKYPNAVFSGKSAYYYYGLTDVISPKYMLTTKREDSRIRNEAIKQNFAKDDIYKFGITNIEYQNTTIRIYSKERLLVDLIRFRARYSLDYYKEIISGYRNILDELDFFEVEDYAMLFKNGNKILNTIQMEVM